MHEGWRQWRLPKPTRSQDGKFLFARFSDRDYLVDIRAKREYSKAEGKVVSKPVRIYRAVTRPATHSELRKIRRQQRTSPSPAGILKPITTAVKQGLREKCHE